MLWVSLGAIALVGRVQWSGLSAMRDGGGGDRWGRQVPGAPKGARNQASRAVSAACADESTMHQQ